MNLVVAVVLTVITTVFCDEDETPESRLHGHHHHQNRPLRPGGGGGGGGPCSGYGGGYGPRTFYDVNLHLTEINVDQEINNNYVNQNPCGPAYQGSPGGGSILGSHLGNGGLLGSHLGSGGPLGGNLGSTVLGSLLGNGPSQINPAPGPAAGPIPYDPVDPNRLRRPNQITTPYGSFNPNRLYRQVNRQINRFFRPLYSIF